MAYIWRNMLYFIFACLFIIAFALLEVKLNFGFSKMDFENATIPLLFFLYFILLVPIIRKKFIKNLIRTRELHLLIAIPILLVLAKLFIVYGYMYLSFLINPGVVSIGSNQYIPSEELTKLGNIVLTGIIGPFNEEVLFRFFLLYLFPYSIYFFMRNLIDKETKKSKIRLIINGLYQYIFIKNNKQILFMWIIIVASIFSIVHGPNLWSFPLYFLGGLLYNYLFLKYGFLTAWFAHGLSNIMSEYIYVIVFHLVLMVL